MTVRELAAACGFEILCGGGEREVAGGVYCCDLLSIVMGRAPADCAWVTVMGNLNSIAVAVMAECLYAGGTPEEAAAAARKRGFSRNEVYRAGLFLRPLEGE